MKPECYRVACMYSSDGCCNCRYEFECYEHLLNYMRKEKKAG